MQEGIYSSVMSGTDKQETDFILGQQRFFAN
jgi:hypothetical protein